MRFSKFCKIYEVCSNSDEYFYLLRHSLLNYSYLLTEPEFNTLKNEIVDNNLKSETSDELFKKHIVVPEHYSEKSFVEYVIKENKLSIPFFSIFYLIFDTTCNLNCKYCYTEGSVCDNFERQVADKNKVTSILEFFNKFLNYAIKNSYVGDKLSIIFYGSEPLMHPDLLELCVSKFNEIEKKFNIEIEKQIVTNGTLINDKNLEILKSGNVSIALSLDGPREVNDTMRIFHNGTGTFEHIMDAINMMKKSGVKFSISCTVASHNVNKLKDLPKYFKSIGAEGMGYNLLLDSKYSNIPSVSSVKCNSNLYDSFDSCLDSGFLESRVGRKIFPFDTQSLHFKDCGAFGNQLVFFPNGDIGVCQGHLGDRDSILGNVWDSADKIVKSNILRDWIKCLPIYRDGCIFCPALGICGGGCPFNTEIKTGVLNERNKKFCMHTLMGLDWLIKKTLEKKLGNDLYYKEITFMYNYSEEIF